MKHILLNLKWFDIPKEYGGVDSIASMRKWGSYIVKSIQEAFKNYKGDDIESVMYPPEAHLIPAVSALRGNSSVAAGCQSVYRDDTAVGGNLGAFTTNRTSNTVKAIGCMATIIGHYEERRDKAEILAEAGVTDTAVVNRLLNQGIKAAVKAGLRVLYYIGESDQEQDRWQEALKEQLETGLDGVDKSMATIAHEPIQAIGPGRTPPGKDYITMIGIYVKEVIGNMDVVYGGGLKVDNTEMLASTPATDGGLIALTRFQGGIGFYPEEYPEIIQTYMGKQRKRRIDYESII